MKWRQNWSVNFLQTEMPKDLPFVARCGGATINSTDYYEDALTRTDSNHVVFQLTLAGEGVYADKTGSYRLLPGDGFLCEVRAPGVKYYYPGDATENWRVVWACILGEQALGTCREIASRYGPVFRLSPESLALGFLMDRNSSESIKRAEPVKVSRTVSWAYSLFAELLHVGERTPFGTVSEQLVEKAKGFIIDNLHYRLKVAEIADHFSITPTHLARVFKEVLGLSPSHFVDLQKCCLAEDLLGAGYRVKEVSWELGYENTNHFIRMFKRIKGVSPGKYQEQMGWR